MRIMSWLGSASFCKMCCRIYKLQDVCLQKTRFLELTWIRSVNQLISNQNSNGIPADLDVKLGRDTRWFFSVCRRKACGRLIVVHFVLIIEFSRRFNHWDFLQVQRHYHSSSKTFRVSSPQHLYQRWCLHTTIWLCARSSCVCDGVVQSCSSGAVRQHSWWLQWQACYARSVPSGTARDWIF